MNGRPVPPISVLFVCTPGVTLDPLRAWTIKPSCQSFVASRTILLLVSPGLMSTDDRLNRCRRSFTHGPSLFFGSGCGLVNGSIMGFANELPISVPGSPWLMHLLYVEFVLVLQPLERRRVRATLMPL